MIEKKIAYSMKEVVEATGLPKSTLQRHINSGDLVSFKVGRRRMVSRIAIETFIKSRERQGQAA